MNMDRSRASVSSGLAFYCRVPGGSSEPGMSTGFYLASTMPNVPPVSHESSPRDASSRSFRAKYHPTSESLPQVPPPTPQLAAPTAAEDYGDVESRDRRLPVAASPSATQLTRRTVSDKASGCLTFLFVTLGLCALVWLLASGTLGNQADVVNLDLDGARDEGAEPVVVLHLEDSSGSVPSQVIKPIGGETVMKMRTRTTMTVGRGKTTTASGWETKSSRDDTVEDELPRARSKARYAEGPRESENANSVDVRPSQDTGPTQGLASVEDRLGSEAVATATLDSPTTRAKHGHSRKGSHKSKRRHLYPRRHIHRMTTLEEEDITG